MSINKFKINIYIIEEANSRIYCTCIAEYNILYTYCRI
jgi:hypothetical protein